MTSLSRFLCVFAITLFASGCSGFVPLHEVDGTRSIDRSLTAEQIKEGILDGAQAAGWNAKVLSSDKILATYHIRVHTVNMEIFYTDSFYRISYKSSSGMKMFCTQRDRDEVKNIKVSGEQECPGGSPLYIHGNYKKWVDSLNSAIRNMLASI